MKPNLLNRLIYILLTFSMVMPAKFAEAKCSWSRQVSFILSDSCHPGNKSASVKGTITMSNSGNAGCYKYTWKVNGNIASKTKNFTYSVTQNGSYSICVTVYDSCNNCDTTYCASKNVSCIKNTCAWYKRSITFTTWDSCKNISGKNSIHGATNAQGKCYKFSWTVNGASINGGNNAQYPISKNGTYTLCLKLSDTCDKCDTTFCKTFTINCFPNSCNWKKQNPYFHIWDTCKNSRGTGSLNGYISFANTNTSCYKYTWMVNNSVVGKQNVMNYPIAKDGTYSICVKVTDTCTQCDTTFCFSKTISCFSGSGCNWKGKKPYLSSWDSCQGNGQRNSIQAFINFNANTSCFKYQWKVNGTILSNDTDNYLSYPISKNGTYTLCVKITDTCHKCDTVICTTKTISCFKSCNWKSRIHTMNFSDTCNGVVYKNSANGYIMLNQNGNNRCVKYQWKVDNKVVSNTNYFSVPMYANGNHTYCVVLIDSCNKCDTSICVTRKFNCQNLGVNAIEEVSVEIYPNPSSGVFLINASSHYDVVVTDLNGKLVWSGSVNSGENSIDLSAFSGGLYIIRLHNDTSSITRKILKE